MIKSKVSKSSIGDVIRLNVNVKECLTPVASLTLDSKYVVFFVIEACSGQMAGLLDDDDRKVLCYSNHFEEVT